MNFRIRCFLFVMCSCVFSVQLQPAMVDKAVQTMNIRDVSVKAGRGVMSLFGKFFKSLNKNRLRSGAKRTWNLGRYVAGFWSFCAALVNFDRAVTGGYIFQEKRSSRFVAGIKAYIFGVFTKWFLPQGCCGSIGEKFSHGIEAINRSIWSALGAVYRKLKII